MDHAVGVKVLKRILAYVDEGTTAMADAPWLNDVTAYTSPDHLAAETRVLFRQHPLLMGLSCDWPKPGDWRTDDLAGVPILVARGRDGVLRAFLNVCRHRGAKVADGCGNAGVFSCPYHAWTYNLDGSLRGIPDERAFEGVRADRRGLTPLPLCERYGLVWVLPTPCAENGTDLDIDPWLGGLASELASYDAGTYHLYAKRLVPETMNWKILVDTFHESYHIGFLHKDSLTSILIPNVADFEAFGPNHRLVFPRRKVERLRATPETEWDLMWNSATVYCLFPNTLLVTQGDHLEIHRIFPTEGRPDRAIMETSFYIPKPIASEEEERHWKANLDLLMNVVLGEDFPAGRTMQIGFGSGAQTHTVLGRNEPAMIHYHQSLRRALSLPV
ncbi:MAG: SRPBCC family protein [Hyphomicrobiaceae bacterium]|nr:SRPBCC family protein [Hyphomicrobiaceae bacterium]